MEGYLSENQLVTGILSRGGNEVMLATNTLQLPLQ